MAANRVLLLHEQDDSLAGSMVSLESAGFTVVHADHQDLFWPKYIETTPWAALVVHDSVLPHITVELGSEVGLSLVAQSVPILLVTSKPPENLPSSLKRVFVCATMTDAAEMLTSDAFKT
jgi:hypothetical protein